MQLGCPLLCGAFPTLRVFRGGTRHTASATITCLFLSLSSPTGSTSDFPPRVSVFSPLSMGPVLPTLPWCWTHYKKSNAVTATEGLALGCSVHLPCLPPCPVPGPHTRCPGLGVPPRCLQGEAQSPAQGDVHGPQSHKTRPPIPTVTASVTLKVKAQPYVCLLSMGCISAKTHQDLLVWTCRGPRASVASLLSGC